MVRARELEDKPPKHVPFDFWMEEKQKEYKNQPWNFLNLAEHDYRRNKVIFLKS